MSAEWGLALGHFLITCVLLYHIERYMMKDRPPKKKRSGPSPPILRKGGPMKDKSKYNRKPKHKEKDHEA